MAVYLGQRRLAVGRRDAAAATALMLTTFIFQFSASVFRNDMLPALMLSAGLLAALAALSAVRARPWLWAAAGLALAAAASTKISFAIPLAAMGVFVGLRVLRARWRSDAVADAAGFGLGAAAGLAPILIYWLGSPDAFRYGVFTFPLQGTFDWYRWNGAGFRLSLLAKIGDSLGSLAFGPALCALVIVALAAGRRWREKRLSLDATAMLDLMVVAGLVAALLPTPTYRNYFMPLLPPLFIRLGMELPVLAALGRGWRRTTFTLLAIEAVAGACWWVSVVGMAVAKTRWTPLQVTAEAHWIGDRLRAAHARGVIATLSPRVALDSGYPLDRRFATGVFVYRSGDRLSADALRRIHAMSPSTAARFLDEAPPAAIVVGYERGSRSFKMRPDDALQAYAEARGYRLERSPWGRAELYIRPPILGVALSAWKRPTPR